MRKYVPWALLLLILMLAIAVRLGPVLFQRDLWYDEAFTGILLRQEWGQMNQMIFDDVHPPLYYWLAKPWSGMFGYTPFGVRSFSMLFGIATVASIFWIGKKIFNTRAGLLAASLVAFSPFAIQYSQEARMYALFGFLFLWSVWFFLRALETGKTQYYLGWGIFSGLAFYTHYLSLFFFVLFYLTYVIYRTVINKKGFFRNLFAERRFWYGVAVIALFFGSWLKIFYVHMMKGNLGWIGVSYPSDIVKTLQIFFFGHPPGTGGVPSPNAFRTISVGKNVIQEVHIFDDYSVGLLVLIIIVGLATYLWCKGKVRKETLVLTLMSFGTLLFLVFLSFLNIKLYVARYFMPAAVLIYLFFSGLIATSFRKKKVWIVLLAYAGLLFLLGPIDYFSGWNDIAQKQDKYFDPETTIVAGNPFDYTTARYYFGKDRVRFYNKGNPEESFNWVLVKDESKLDSPEEIKDLADAMIVDESCQWEDIELVQRWQVGKLAICSLVNN